MGVERHSQGLGSDIGEVARATKPGSQPPGVPAQLRRARVTGVDEDGAYTIALVGAMSTTTDTIARVRAWGGATFTIGEFVWLYFEPSRPVPWLLSAGGGGEGGPMLQDGSGLGFLAE